MAKALKKKVPVGKKIAAAKRANPLPRKNAKKPGKRKGRYTLTARLEGEWRWAVVDGPSRASKATMIDLAQDVLKRKVKEAKAEAEHDPEKKGDVVLWTEGGVTLTNPEGRIIWSRSRT